MFGKTKQIQEEVDIISSKISEKHKLIDELAGHFKKEIEELKELKSEQIGFLADIKRNTDEIKQLKNDLDEEVKSFKIFRIEIQKQIVDQFERELKQNFLEYNESLKLDKESYEARKEQINAMVKDMSSLKSSIENLSRIAGKIRKEDFELTQFHTKIMEEDKNKLELMKRIDFLEKVCARLKRGVR